MSVRRVFGSCLAIVLASSVLLAQTPVPSSSSSKKPRQPPSKVDSALDIGSISNAVYRNQSFGFSCKVPEGWVLRTEEMNAPRENEGDEAEPTDEQKGSSTATAKSDAKAGDKGKGASGGTVLLAAFSRPPEAKGEDVNSSIVIAAESVAAYPGLKDAAQYFGPLTEVAAAQGFEVVDEPYEFPVGAKQLVRSDFAVDRGTRVMHQATLAMLGHGYAVSFTFIGGTADEVEELIGKLSFVAGKTGP